MKYISYILIILLLFSVSVSAQRIGKFEEEPTEEELGAPLFPGADFIRKTPGLNPIFETAVYISLVPIKDVDTFFKKRLQEKRIIYYSDDDTYLTAYLLKTWSKFPSSPTKEELERLENEPTVQVMYYDPNAYEPLAEFFEKIPGGKVKAATIRNGKTMIRYTYVRSEKSRSSKRIIGTWRETSRDLKQYFGSTIQFNEDGTYIFTLTPNNIAEMVKNPFLRKMFGIRNEEDLRKHIESINPETGKYSIMRNSITLASENPIDGQNLKSGLAKVGPVMLSMTLINKPRLTFMRRRQKPPTQTLRPKKE
ncbi:hypothetical protein ACFL50_06090 [Candidatus Latescibacterota bacterium]